MAMDFSSDYLQAIATMDPPNQGTVSVWIKTDVDSSGNHQRILGFTDAFEIRIRYASGDANRFYNDLFVAGGGGNLSSITTVVAGIWYNYIANWNYSTNLGEIYVNGEFDNSWLFADDDPGTGTLSIGTRTGKTNYFDGVLDDIRIYNRILSANEIRTIYAARGGDSIVNGLINKWLMNENVGTASGTGAIKDLSGSGLNMTPNNNPIFTESVAIEKYRRRY